MDPGTNTLICLDVQNGGTPATDFLTVGVRITTSLRPDAGNGMDGDAERRKGMAWERGWGLSQRLRRTALTRCRELKLTAHGGASNEVNEGQRKCMAAPSLMPSVRRRVTMMMPKVAMASQRKPNHAKQLGPRERKGAPQRRPGAWAGRSLRGRCCLVYGLGLRAAQQDRARSSYDCWGAAALAARRIAGLLFSSKCWFGKTCVMLLMYTRTLYISYSRKYQMYYIHKNIDKCTM
jgi:hypothetical protein